MVNGRSLPEDRSTGGNRTGSVPSRTSGAVVVGEFVERPDHPHAALRERLLLRSDWLPEPPFLVELSARAEDARRLIPGAHEAMADTGLLKLAFDRPLSGDELLGLASGFGDAQDQPGTHQLPQYLERDLIFNVRQDVAAVDPDDALGMVSTNPLRLHSEISMRPLHLQPRLVALLCVEAPERDRGGQTIVVPMADVHAELSSRESAILRGVRFEDFPHAPTLLRQEGSHPVFSFRDWADGLRWEYLGEEPGVTETEVNAAIALVLEAMYAPDNTWGIHWARGSLLVFDNWRYFHGRTQVQGSTEGNARHLKRLYLGRGREEVDRTQGARIGAGPASPS